MSASAPGPKTIDMRQGPSKHELEGPCPLVASRRRRHPEGGCRRRVRGVAPRRPPCAMPAVADRHRPPWPPPCRRAETHQRGRATGDAGRRRTVRGPSTGIAHRPGRPCCRCPGNASDPGPSDVACSFSASTPAGPTSGAPRSGCPRADGAAPTGCPRLVRCSPWSSGSFPPGLPGFLVPAVPAGVGRFLLLSQGPRKPFPEHFPDVFLVGPQGIWRGGGRRCGRRRHHLWTPCAHRVDKTRSPPVHDGGRGRAQPVDGRRTGS